MNPVNRRLAAALAAAWEAEVSSAQRMTALAERMDLNRRRSRLLVLSAFCRAHASRLLARLSALGRGPLPVPPGPVELSSNELEELLLEARVARDASARYRTAADIARTQGDLSSAWVCELNAAEEEDRAVELLEVAREVQQADLPGAGAV